jgi:hypothetical protein
MSIVNMREFINSGNESEHKLKQIITNVNFFLCFFTIGISFIIGGTVLLEFCLKYKSFSDELLIKQGVCIILFGCVSSGISLVYLIVALIKYVKYRNQRQNHIFRCHSLPFTISSEDFNYPLQVFPRNSDSFFDPPPPYSTN